MLSLRNVSSIKGTCVKYSVFIYLLKFQDLLSIYGTQLENISLCEGSETTLTIHHIIVTKKMTNVEFSGDINSHISIVGVVVYNIDGWILPFVDSWEQLIGLQIFLYGMLTALVGYSHG